MDIDMSMGRWRAVRCQLVGDLYPRARFISFLDAWEAFGNVGQCLHYARLERVAQELWVTFQEAPNPRWTLTACGEGRHLITLFYRALEEDGKKRPVPAHDAWERKLGVPFEDAD
ncbi:hypothetical protein NDU88_005894 [Pleurodeles waltl]|uniref:Uncharacterized protein n=1 Tax=Pleurodeles waltl TaxID=8319 RepID=A0AAV7SMZ6_PLEWA|nr:hypothetical protein NDU88_005894 [Pleurodeles waltl]